jgi:hypothetical protein
MAASGQLGLERGHGFIVRILHDHRDGYPLDNALPNNDNNDMVELRFS